MTDNDADVAGLVAARICHDLANPLGAIGNGVDLMRELGEATAEDLKIVADAQLRSVALLGFHRLAFGAAAPDSARVERSEIAARCEAALATARVTFSWEGEAGTALTRPCARLAALMVLSARTLAGIGGRIDTSFSPETCTPLSVVAESDGARWEDALKALLRNGSGADARTVEFALLSRAAQAAGCRLDIIEEDGRAGLVAT